MNSYILRLKLFFRDRTACICLFLTAVIMLAVLTGLNVHAVENSALPVGLLTHVENESTNDHDVTAQRIAARIRENEALAVYENDPGELKRLLADGYIYCIIEFEPDIGKRIENGEYKGIMTMHSAKDSPVATIIGDIAAGCAMDEICLNKAYICYSELDGGESARTDMDEYRNRLYSMRESGGYDFVFETEYIDTGKKAEDNINNAIIYRQVIAGLTAMLIMLAAFCACGPVCMEYAQGIRGRLKVTSTGRIRLFVYEALALFTCCAPLAVLAGILCGTHVSAVFIMSLLNIIVLACSTAVFYFLSTVLKNVLAFQIAGTVLILLLSGMGFVSIFEGLAGEKILYYTPIALYIRQYTDLFMT